jgi:anthranilate/para-aminobenzoate synthase component I
MSARISSVGARPGDPGLLTVRGGDLLRRTSRGARNIYSEDHGRHVTGLRLIVGTEPALLFERSRETLRWSGATEARATFERLEDALHDGSWIAGYVAYDGGSAIGVFDPPREMSLPELEHNVEHSPLLPLVSRETYDARVRALQTAIREGDVYQAYVEDDAIAILSWSPELFLSFEGRRLVSKPMKGTARLERLDDLRNEKNRAEHVMIVDLLRNDLHRICDHVEVEAFQTIECYPHYATMTSRIAGTVRHQTPLGEIFEAMFPCGSVTGAPKRSAMRFIAQYEAQARGVYCGSIGYLSPGRRGWWNVAIRTAQFDRLSGLGRFDAGGAIVADSQPAAEWKEISVKSSFLQNGAASSSSKAPFALLETFASYR